MFPQTRLLTEKASNWLESMSLAIRVLKAQRTWKGTVLWLDRIKAISCGRARILSASNGSLGGLSSCCTSKLLSLRGSKWRGLMVSAVGAEAPFLSTAGFVRTNFFQPSLRGEKKTRDERHQLLSDETDRGLAEQERRAQDCVTPGTGWTKQLSWDHADKNPKIFLAKVSFCFLKG